MKLFTKSVQNAKPVSDSNLFALANESTEKLLSFSRSKLAACAALILAAGAVQAQAMQFDAAPQTDALFAQVSSERVNFADGALSAVLAESTTSAPRVIAVKELVLTLDTATVTLDLGQGLVVRAAKNASFNTDDGLLVWQGSSRSSESKFISLSKGDDRAANEVTLVRNGAMVTGNIRVRGQLFELRPMFDGNHVLYAVNETLRLSDHGSRYDESRLAQQGEAAAAPAPEAVAANTVIRTMVVISATAKAQLADPVGYVTTAFSETNTGYANSGVQITNQQAGPLYTATYTESGDLEVDLNRFALTNDGILDSVHTLRNTNTADVVVFMVDAGAFCGLARNIPANASSAFAVVKRSCAVGNYSFGHEIGHLQGARHNPQNDPTTTPYTFGHGFQDPAGAFRTIMAYPCSSGACPRLNYWSNPTIKFNNKALGNTTASDNARVLNTTRTTVAGFR
jgi:peptidyl-Asp metalloendopeptidase